MTEGPYKLPEGWRWVRLGEVAEKPQYGYTSSALSEPVGSKFLRITDITSGAIDWDSVPHCKIDSETFKKYQLKSGDLLFARSGSIGATILIREIPCKAVFASYLIRVRLRSEAFPEFVSLNLKAPFCQKQFIPLGAAQKNINAKAIQQILIPLPPLSEQRRIVARIEELMSRIREARRLREEARQDAERLWQSALAEVFPRPGAELPPGWRWVRLGEIAKIFSGSPAPQGWEYFNKGTFPFVRVQDLGRHGITTDLKETADKVNGRAVREFRLVKASKGAILFPKSGAAILTNSRAILGTDAYIVSHLAGINHNLDFAESLWIFHWLCTVDMSEYVDNPAYPSLRLSKVREIPLPLPPLDEQRRIVAYLEAVQHKVKALKEAQAATDAELKSLEQAILDKAFRGEL